MQFIKLSQGKIAILDDEDFARFSHFHWCFRGERKSTDGYAIRHAKEEKKYRTVYLHREVMGPIPPECEVIFRNGDRLDCRKENLLVVSKQEARQHHQRAKSNKKTSGMKGLSYNPRPGTWSVDIYRNGRAQRIGTFLTQREAMDAHQKALESENADLHTAPARVDRPIVTISPAASTCDGDQEPEREPTPSERSLPYGAQQKP